jgi:hypothetical protein
MCRCKNFQIAPRKHGSFGVSKRSSSIFPPVSPLGSPLEHVGSQSEYGGMFYDEGEKLN